MSGRGGLHRDDSSPRCLPSRTSGRSRSGGPRLSRSWSSAADFAGADYGLRAMFQHMCAAHDEREFDEAFDKLVASLSESTTRYLQSA